jgi:hypothetical protein
MRLHRKLKIAFTVIAIFCLSNASLSQELTTYHASMCQGNGKFHDDALKIDPVGLTNKLVDRNIWVTCPLPAQYLDDTATDAYIYAILFNRGEHPAKVSCILVGADYDGNTISRSETASVNPSDVQYVEWTLFDTELVVASFACKLPPKTGLSGYLVGFGSS